MRKYLWKITLLATLLAIGCLFLFSSCGFDSVHIHYYESTRVDPTCTEGGYLENTCSCGDSYRTEETDPLGHTELIDPGTPPTCTEGGIQDGITCTVCGATIQEKMEVGPIPHSYAEEYLTDENGHYRLCSCGAEGHRGEHASSAPATATDAETCAECGFVMLEPTGITFGELPLVDNEVSTSVGTTEATFSFTNAITVVGNTTFTVYSDSECTVALGAVVALNEGSNVFFIKESHTGAENVYKVTVYRLHLYTVEFIVGEGYAPVILNVEEGSTVTPPTVSREGYDFLRWNFDFTTPITEDTTVTSEWKNKTDVAYSIVVYTQNIYDNNYSIYSTDVRYGETGASVSTEERSIEHFLFREDLSTLSATVKPDGTTELSLYYDRMTYTVTLRDEQAGEIRGLGTYRYGEMVTVEATTYLGYHFLGWYTGETYLTNLERTFFEMYYDIEARFTVGSYMEGFTFESTSNSCTIVGVPSGSTGVVTLPSCVTEIAPGAFRDMTGITRIVIPQGVVSIGAYAFSGIRAEIVLENGVELKIIGTFAFAGYLGDVIELPGSVTTIETDAFADCASEIRWGAGSSVTTLKTGAFRGYKGETLTLPPRLNTIQANAFEGCIFLKIFFLGEAEDWARITIASGNDILINITVYFYAEENPNREGNYWYYGELGITIYPLHEHTVTTLAGYAPTCTKAGLTDGTHCSVCEKVFTTQETIPATGHTEVTYPGYAATCAYTGRKDGKICSTCGVETVARQVIATKSHSNDANGVCTVCGHLPATANSYFTFKYSSTYGGYLVAANGTLPANVVIPTTTTTGAKVVGIADEGFKGQTALRFVELHSGIAYIGASAFADCQNMVGIFVPSSVNTIGSKAFSNANTNYRLQMYTQFSAKQTGWASNAVSDANIIYNALALARDTEGSPYVLLKDMDLRLAYNFSTQKNYHIPSQVAGTNVTSIGTMAFLNSGSQYVYLPDTIQKIYTAAFTENAKAMASSYLRGIFIPKEVKTIETAALSFYGTYLNVVVVTDATEIPEGWHYKWTNGYSRVYTNVSEIGESNNYTYCVTNGEIIVARYYGAIASTVTIPETLVDKTVVGIGIGAFINKGANGFVLPDTIKVIYANAFYECWSTRTITLGSGLESIGDQAFYNTQNLTSINLPEGLRSIGAKAFYGSGLRTVTIPASVEIIGANAFSFDTITEINTPLAIVPTGWAEDIASSEKLKLNVSVS